VSAPAITSAIDAVVARIEAITPTIDAEQTFRRLGEVAPASTRAGKRLFDFDFGALRDLSNEGQGVQNPGLADRLATVEFVIDYPIARAERALETTIAIDAELVLRALGRSANWTGTTVRRVVASTVVDRNDSAEVPIEGGGTQPGVLHLVVTAAITYRDAE
jgi:hypothetical protein